MCRTGPSVVAFQRKSDMPRVLLFNKPYGVLCQFTDQQGRATLADYIAVKGVYPAGRLDRDSEGLVILTDTGSLQHRIAHPLHKMSKRYLVQVEGAIDEKALQQLRGGLTLNDGPTLPAEAEAIDEPSLWPRTPPVRYRAAIPTSWLALNIREGRNRQVRRMTAAVGYPTLRLIRQRVGDWSLDGLEPGQWRELPADELQTLLKGLHRDARHPPRSVPKHHKRL